MKLFPLLCLALLVAQSAHAAVRSEAKSTVTVSVEDTDPFRKGGHELDIADGFFYSPVLATGGRPVLKYVQGDLSLGCMLTAPSPLCGHDWLRGNWEGLLNVFGADVVKGPDGFLVGGRLLLRYNFVQPQARWVPFFQLGAGALGDDVYRHRDQRVVGGGFEFTLVADAGLRYFITPQWAAVLMADYEHVSNAGTASRNLGVNAVGGTLGAGYFF